LFLSLKTIKNSIKQIRRFYRNGGESLFFYPFVFFFFLSSFFFLFGISAHKEGKRMEDELEELTEMLGLSC